MEASAMPILEIFESSGSKRVLRPPAERPGTCREAVEQWAKELGRADCAPFQVRLQNRMRGHELYEVKVGARVFSIVVH